MIRPLIINRPYLFDQSAGGECLRTFVRALDKERIDPTIYGSDKTPQVDKKGDNVILTHEYRFVQYVAAAIRRLLIPDLTYLPGYEWYSWGIGSKREILKNINKGVGFDYIHSVSFPCACHKVALEVKKATGLPWVAQLYDPWADNPYRRFKTNYFKKIDWKQERDCVEYADLIILSNDYIANVWRERYGKEFSHKIVVLPFTIPVPNVVVKENNHKCGEILTISHIGNFMLNRTSQSFIMAVLELISRYPDYRRLLKINYIGNVTEIERGIISKYGLCDIFNLVGTISADACVEYYQNSDVFLAVDGVNKDNLFFPSKILKYLYFCRPILGITPKGSVLDGELQHSGHVSIDNGDYESITKFLERALTNYESLLNFRQDYWLNFEPSNVVRKYEEMIRQLLKK